MRVEPHRPSCRLGMFPRQLQQQNRCRVELLDNYVAAMPRIAPNPAKRIDMRYIHDCAHLLKRYAQVTPTEITIFLSNAYSLAQSYQGHSEGTRTLEMEPLRVR